ncbi:hypothetical protein X801_10365 [Opisthorchis viverrini]|uniref:Malate/L-lactate dehydrogenase n=1 Tax=Opisthorchis viverrini TaxID=6198 RepID=A0A1S8WHC4_OPIVI|nr:hypothetical protein X801_10365 [Opisthorchis viverrini]
MYVLDVEKSVCEKAGEPVIEKETVSTALVNGRNLLGPVVGNFCMKLAIEKAKKTGIAWVTAYGSNHFGIAGWYSLMASNAGLLVSYSYVANASYLGNGIHEHFSLGLPNKVKTEIPQGLIFRNAHNSMSH